jgi:hypothetical protein
MPSSKRRGSRAKRRPTGRARAATSAESAQRAPAEARPEGSAQRRRPQLERPRAPWHPFPLSELLIIAGAVAVLFALANGPQHSVPALLAGLAAVAIGTLEVTLREHLAGYRSHAMLLALVAVAVMHTALLVVLSSFVSFPRAANVALLALDVAVAFVLFRFLRARYVEARRQAILTARSR